jgi:hypothetical protein
MKRNAHRAVAAAAAALAIAATGFVMGYAVAAQPHMQNAISALQTAKSELQVAEHNKGGHRAKALGLVNDAISEVNAGIAAGS